MSFWKSKKEKPTVLLADDDEMACMMLSQKLADHNYDVTVVNNGLDAIEISKDHNFDFLITDIIMPEVEGIEVISEVIDRSPRTKIIAISSDGLAGHSTLLTIAQTVGASAALQKPVRPDTLLETMNNVQD